MYIIIDLGSTATRMYLMDGEQCVCSARQGVGTNESAKSGSNRAVKDCMQALYKKLLSSSGADSGAIRFAAAAGMITSELGLLAVPHQFAPAGVQELLDGITVVTDPEVSALPIPLLLVAGIKNNVLPAGFGDLFISDLMRGEEVQAIGVLSTVGLGPPFTIIELGSTTKLIGMDQNGRIAASATSLSGQCYGAIMKETFIGASIKEHPETPEPEGYFDPGVVDAAIESVQKFGFLRTMMMIRFSQIVLPTKWYERKLFAAAAFAADDIKLFTSTAKELDLDMGRPAVLVGAPSRCVIYKYILEKSVCPSQITILSDGKEIDRLSIRGMSAIFSRNPGSIDRILSKEEVQPQ